MPPPLAGDTRYANRSEAPERLKLLEVILPPLSPTLPSPPTSPRWQDQRGFKRQRDHHHEGHETEAHLGLGFGLEGLSERAPEAKRLQSMNAPIHGLERSASQDGNSRRVPGLLKVGERERAAQKGHIPEIRSVPSSSKFENTLTNGAQGLASTPPEGDASFTKERLRKLALSYRERGLNQKHTGDKTARSAVDDIQHTLSVVQQTEAILLYLFAFWADDAASKLCIAQNWHSVLPLLIFVRSRAIHLGLSVITGICLRMEAIVAHLLAQHERRVLHHKALQLASMPAANLILTGPSPLLRAKEVSENGLSPQSLPGTSPPDASKASDGSNTTHPAPSPAKPSPDFLRSFMAFSSDVSRAQKLWDESKAHLAPRILRVQLPETWRLCTETNVHVDSKDLIVPSKPWTFAWPDELGGSVAHAVAFARAILEEWAASKGVPFTSTAVQEG